jgi:hypothetical protein
MSCDSDGLDPFRDDRAGAEAAFLNGEPAEMPRQNPRMADVIVGNGVVHAVRPPAAGAAFAGGGRGTR